MSALQHSCQSLSRRTFIGRAAGAAAALIAGSKTFGQSTSRPEEGIPRPCPPSAWKKHGVVIEPTEPWEEGGMDNFHNCAEPLGGDRWRLWYDTSKTLAYAEGVPGGKMKKVPARFSTGRPADEPFAVGNLPEGWRPSQYTYIRLKNGKHRIYAWTYAPGVDRLLVAESDDGRRFSVLDPLRPALYHFNDRASQGIPNYEGVIYPPKGDGKRPADEPPAQPHQICNDVTNIYQLPDGTFEIYATSVIRVPKEHPRYTPEDNTIGALRLIDRFTSEDGLHFENRRRAVQWDDQDSIEQQFYYLAVTYTPKGRVGMLGHYLGKASTTDVEWCFSKDGLKWHRPCRTPWIPRGDESQPDSYAIYTAQNIVPHQGRHHLFYTAMNSAHNGKHSHGPPRVVIMYASTESIWA